MTSQPQVNTTVIIVGAGVAGLTLALSLEQANIPFVVLEAHQEVAPQVGASLGLLPNGLLILDQLGVYEDIRSVTTPCCRSFHRSASGNVLLDSNAFGYFDDELGYHMVLLERQTLLRLMYEKIRDKTQIRTDSRVVAVKESPSGVEVVTQQGTLYHGKIGVGADGVHSRIRACIALELEGQEVKTNLNSYLSAKFSCVFGISNPIETLPPGEVHFTFQQGHNFALFTGKDGIIYWFLFEDMGKTFEQGSIPRFNSSDADVSCQKYLSSPITSSVRFGDIYSKQIVKTKTAFEEGVASHWRSGRVVLVGDSAHKMTTNSAMGGNMAIESAACLANCLVRAMGVGPDDVPQKGQEVDFVDLSERLDEYQQIRIARAKKARLTAGKLTRAQFLPNLWGKFAIRYLLPLTTAAGLLNTFLKALEGGVKVDFIPVPKRARRPPGPSLISRQHEALPSGLDLRTLGFLVAATLALAFTVIKHRP